VISSASEFCADVSEHSVCSIFIDGVSTTYEDGTECSETSAHKIQSRGLIQKKEYNLTRHLMFNGTCIILIVELRETNLISLALLFHYLLFSMFRMLIHPSSGACDLFVELFHGLYCSGSMRVGVTLWFGRGGVVSICRLKQCNTTHEITQQISRNLLRMDVLTSETC